MPLRPVVIRTIVAAACLVGMVLWGAAAAAQPADAGSLADGLRPFWRVVEGKQSFKLTGQMDLPIDGHTEKFEFSLTRYGNDAFDLILTHSDYDVRLRRRAKATALALPKHNVVFLARGEVHEHDNLAPLGIAERLIGPGTQIAKYIGMVSQADPHTAALLLVGILGVQQDAESGKWKSGDNIAIEFANTGALALQAENAHVQCTIGDVDPVWPAVDVWPEMRAVELDRQELERQLARGVRRMFEIVAPSERLTKPAREPRRTDHGELRWIDGQRVALLHGSPEQIGAAHGELLRDEAMSCIDSVLNAFGTVHTIRHGTWFRHDLQEAYTRLKPHIPQRHLVETRALAQALGEDAETIEALNVFPEMFHCSGFALFGEATRDGKLYHGRVLDYMTEIGLQDAAVTFVVKATDQIPFANVGYAGFIGSVSGMNAQAISLGEMGGRGEGQWDGVPMATLMRRALEECSSLDEVMHLWKSLPRTCEYYYVFADGKTNQAVGVAAVPDAIDFVFPGQSHPRLGEGIADTVLLSAGSRLELLRERTKTHYGQFDAERAMWLMSRPVAMKSNLHNVLFIPEEGVLYVANADHNRPAAECAYSRLDLKALISELPAATHTRRNTR